jgi:DNA replication protein DnaC
VLYTRFVRLLEKLRIASGDGNFTLLLTQLAKTEVTILDD